MPKSTYLNENNKTQAPAVVYNQTWLFGNPFHCNVNPLSTNDIDVTITPIARGKGGVKESVSENPEEITLTGEIVPRKCDHVWRDMRELIQYLKSIFASDSSLLYFFHEEWQTIYNLDDDNTGILFGGDISSQATDYTLRPQRSNSSTYAIIDTVNNSNGKVTATVSSSGVDLSGWFTTDNRLYRPTLATWIYLDNPSPVQQLSALQFLIGSDSTNYIAYDTSVIPGNITNINGKPLKAGWNMVTFPLFQPSGGGFVPMYQTVGNPDLTKMGAFAYVNIEYLDTYKTTEDRFGLNSMIIFNASETRIRDVVVASKLDIQSLGDLEHISNQVADSWSIDLVNTSTRISNFVDQSLNLDIDDGFNILSFDLLGEGEQFPILSFQVNSPDVGGFSIQTLQGSEKIEVVKESGEDWENETFTIDTFRRTVSNTSGQIVNAGSIPRFVSGRNNIIFKYGLTALDTTTNTGFSGSYEYNNRLGVVVQSVEDMLQEFPNASSLFSTLAINQVSFTNTVILNSIEAGVALDKEMQFKDYQISDDISFFDNPDNSSMNQHVNFNIFFVVYADDGSGSPDFTNIKYKKLATDVEGLDKNIEKGYVADYDDNHYGKYFIHNVTENKYFHEINDKVELSPGDYWVGYIAISSHTYTNRGRTFFDIVAPEKGNSSPTGRTQLWKTDFQGNPDTRLTSIEPENIALKIEGTIPPGGISATSGINSLGIGNNPNFR